MEVNAPVSESVTSRTPEFVAALIDHTLLKPDAPQSDIARICEEAIKFNLFSVCVNPCNIAQAVSLLQSSPVRVCTVVGFPLGAGLTSSKRFEAGEALRLGASELDMVINIGALKSGNRQLVLNDIRGVAEVAHDARALLKVILETPLLTLEEKISASQLSMAAGADFIKTCTGFSGGAATVDDVALMRGVVGNAIGVKASGGIRTATQLTSLLDAGANRIGTSSALSILHELAASAAIQLRSS